MTNSYCQFNESAFWFPIGPNTSTLPPLPGETINTSPRPANSVEVPPGFDIDNPDLCELFNDILPVNTNPVYQRTVTVGVIVPPYFEIVYYDLRVRSYLTLKKYEYDLTPSVDLSLTLRHFLYVASYPYIVVPTVKLGILTGTTEIIDFQVAILKLSLKVDASITVQPSILLHFDGEPGSTNFINYGGVTGAIVSSVGDPVIVNNLGKFGGSSVFMYGNPSYIKVSSTGIVVTETGPAITFSGWINLEDVKGGTYHTIMAVGDSHESGQMTGLFMWNTAGSNYVQVLDTGYSRITYYLPDDTLGQEFQGKWIYWALQKNSGSGIWTLHFSNYIYEEFEMFTSSSWYGSNGNFYFGGSTTTYVSYFDPLYGAMDEIAIHYGVALHSFTEPLTSSDFPSGPYSPSSGFFSETVTTKLAIDAAYQAVDIVYSVDLVVKVTVPDYFISSNAIVTVVDYTGTGANRTVSTPDIQPSLVWFKNLGNTVSGQSPSFLDKNRGTGRYNAFALATTDYTATSMMTSFDSQGITLNTTSTLSNANGIAYRLVAFGNTYNSYVDSTTNSIPVTIANNKEFGFSICTWTGDGSNGASRNFAHGLGNIPEFIILKANASIRPIWCGSLFGSNQILTNEQGTSIQSVNYISYNSSYISVYSTAGSSYFNRSSALTAMYCFSSVAGKTKFGFYDGLSLVDKNVNVGFQPSLVIIRQWTNVTSTTTSVAYSSEVNQSWRIFDDVIDSTFTSDISVTSTGFSLPTSSSFNVTGNRYFYMAFRDVIT